MNTHTRAFKNIVLGLTVIFVLTSGLAHAGQFSNVSSNQPASPQLSAKKPKLLVINEFHSYGSASNEWVELYNPNATTYANYTDLKLSDQDGHVVNLSAAGITSVPPHNYILVRFGAGKNDTSFSNGTATVYAWMSGNILNDDGDDILIYNGTYEKPGCEYLDYVAYSNGGPNQDLDQPPIGSFLNFTRDGRGHFGYIQAPGPNESASLVPNGDDKDRASNWYLTRDRLSASGTAYVDSMTPGTENVNILKVTATNIAPTNITQGNSSLVLKLTLSGIGVPGEYMQPMDMIIGINGTLDPQDIADVTLFNSAGNPLDSHPFGPNKKVVLGNFNYGLHVGETQVYYIGVKLNKDASIYKNFTISVVDFDMQPRSWDQTHNDEVFFPKPIVTSYIYVSPIDKTPPTVSNVAFNRHMPLGPGTHYITITFDKAMNTTFAPNVTYGLYGYEYNVSGSWISSTTWSGAFNISANGPHGKLVLLISGARDMSYNLMIPYKSEFIVHTERPYIKNIEYNALSPYPAGFPVNITVYFSENVTGVYAKLISKNNQVLVNVFQENNTVYSLHFNTQLLRTGNYTLLVYNATDSAGNVMHDFTTNISIDKSPPVISYVSYKMSVVEGNNVSFLVYATDNIGVKKVWAVYYYKGEEFKVEANRMGEYWTFQVAGGAVTPGTVTVDIYVEDIAGNIMKDEETITVMPWWQAVWWLWVILAIIFGFIVFLVYDYAKRNKLRGQLGEELVSEAILVRMAKKFKMPKRSQHKTKKKKKVKQQPDEAEEEEEEYTLPPEPPEALPTIPSERTESPQKKEKLPEVPYEEEEYLEEETVEREE